MLNLGPDNLSGLLEDAITTPSLVDVLQLSGYSESTALERYLIKKPIMFSSEEDVEGRKPNEEVGSNVSGSEGSCTLVLGLTFGLVEGKNDLEHSAYSNLALSVKSFHPVLHR